MARFVLVHGAWHGGWCWRDTAAALRRQGHEVLAPTLSGNAEYRHQGHQGITLETHVRDVAGVIESHELDDAILVGHSYGGMVITGVADRMPGRIRHLVYLDAFVPRHGDSLIGLLRQALPAEIAQAFIDGFRGSAAADHAGMIAPIPAETFGIDPANRERVDRLCHPQSLATFEMPLLLGGDGEAERLPKHYILASGWDPSPFRHFAATTARGPGWTLSDIPCSHDVMVDRPDELAADLARLA